VLKGFDQEILTLINIMEIEDEIMESKLVLDKITQSQNEIAAVLSKPVTRRQSLVSNTSKVNPIQIII